MRPVMPGKDPQGAAVKTEPLNVLNHERVASHQSIQGGQRKIEKVLVVDGVKFHLIDHVLHIRNSMIVAPLGFNIMRRPPMNPCRLGTCAKTLLA